MWVKKIVIKSFNWALSVSSFVGVVLTFCFFNGPWWVGLIVFVALSIAIWLSVFLTLLLRKHHKISSRGSVVIEAMYGNILTIKKEKKELSKPVIVIPANSSFDTEVEDDPSIVDRIIEGSCIHGQWLKKYAKNTRDLKKIDEDISRYIKRKGMVPKDRLKSKRGKKDRYGLGSYVFVERPDYSFLLFALTEFDEHNKVIKKDPETFVALMNSLMDALDECAGKHVYIPVMGTKIGLFGINEASSFEYIKNAALNKKNSLRSTISIVVFADDRDKVSIFD